MRFVIAAATAIFVACQGCQFGTTPPPEMTPPTDPPPPVECGAHAWGDDDENGVGYRWPSTDINVINTSGYPLDLDTLGMGVLDFSDSGHEIPMVRVNQPGNGWLGLAQVWINNRTGMIDRARVQMNEGYPQMSDPRTFTHVGCMEVLHCVGFEHDEAQDTCTNDCSGASDWLACMRDPRKSTPGVHDLEQASIIYGVEPTPPTVCVRGEFTLKTFTFPAPGEKDDHDHP